MTANATPVSRRVGELTLTLASDTEIVMTRTFDAPRALVFKAHTSCGHIREWWGRRQDTMPSCEMDFRPGGAWRFVSRDDEGNEFVFFGEYRTIVEPERIDWTFGFEGMPGEPGLETLTLEERAGRRCSRHTRTSTRSRRVTRPSRAAWSTVQPRHGIASLSISSVWPDLLWIASPGLMMRGRGTGFGGLRPPLGGTRLRHRSPGARCDADPHAYASR